MLLDAKACLWNIMMILLKLNQISQTTDKKYSYLCNIYWNRMKKELHDNNTQKEQDTINLSCNLYL